MRGRNQYQDAGSRDRGRWDGPPDHFGWGPGRRGRRGGPGRRARRGDVRAAALALLGERPMHGYEMIQELEERTDGVWRPSPGAVYPALQLLEDQGFVTADAEAGKRLYSLTDAGREEAAKLGDRKPWDEVTAGIDPTQFRLRDALGPIAVAARQVAIDGTPAQQAAAADILLETRRKLYALLAEAPATDTSTEPVDES
jgi:DNA-binding PadR family transcriptional regulator